MGRYINLLTKFPSGANSQQTTTEEYLSGSEQNECNYNTENKKNIINHYYYSIVCFIINH